jgi:hypothetical protein
MGHIVLGTPGIDRFHLHERLVRDLRQRGHRVDVVCLDAVAQRFWRHQDEATVALREPAGPFAVPIDELAPGVRAAARRALAASGAALHAWLVRERADLVLLHQDRTTEARVVQFVARAAGCRVLWTAAGLLPHTLQIDERGVDGEASCVQRAAHEFRVVSGEPELLQACLANALARTTPQALPRSDVRVPPWRERWSDFAATCCAHGVRRAVAGLRAWRRALPPREPRTARWTMPAAPFVVVLLQHEADARVRLDAPGAPSPDALVRATAEAVRGLGDVRLAVVGDDATRARTVAGEPVLPAQAAPDLVATALATVTINHPLAALALLAGTPVLHCGDALYGLRGVATRTTVAQLAGDLAQALAHDYPTLRERFLSWLFGHGHVWCSPTHPDHNGMLGFVAAIEARLAEPASPRPALRYRRGPGWPLAAEPRRP